MQDAPSVDIEAVPDQGIVRLPVFRADEEVLYAASDLVVVEEPLEIRLGYDQGAERTRRSLSVTMRTPGQDVDLAVGFLFTEGIIQRLGDIDTLRHSGPSGGKQHNRNILTVELKPGVAFDMAQLERHFYTTSSCGVCGKTSLEAVYRMHCPVLAAGTPFLEGDLVRDLPERLRAAQATFEATGGLHAAALFDEAGTLVTIREDVGRHNAVDKLIGARLLAGQMLGRVLLVSGRVSFELAQKALVAGIPVLAAVGAPSSLAVELAQAHNMTLVGFVRDRRFNVYSGPERIRMPEARSDGAAPLQRM